MTKFTKREQNIVLVVIGIALVATVIYAAGLADILSASQLTQLNQNQQSLANSWGGSPCYSGSSSSACNPGCQAGSNSNYNTCITNCVNNYNTNILPVCLNYDYALNLLTNKINYLNVQPRYNLNSTCILNSYSNVMYQNGTCLSYVCSIQTTDSSGNRIPQVQGWDGSFVDSQTLQSCQQLTNATSVNVCDSTNNCAVQIFAYSPVTTTSQQSSSSSTTQYSTTTTLLGSIPTTQPIQASQSNNNFMIVVIGLGIVAIILVGYIVIKRRK